MKLQEEKLSLSKIWNQVKKVITNSWNGNTELKNMKKELEISHETIDSVKAIVSDLTIHLKLKGYDSTDSYLGFNKKLKNYTIFLNYHIEADVITCHASFNNEDGMTTMVSISNFYAKDFNHLPMLESIIRKSYNSYNGSRKSNN